MGKEYHGYELPRRYFPVMLTITLTEPTWPLFLFGLYTTSVNFFRQKVDRIKMFTLFLWFGMVFLLLITINPPNSDGYRHYLFILPPVFLFAGFALNKILAVVKNLWGKSAVIMVILLPALWNNVALHPYQYTYYNSFVGGTEGAFRRFETDYWLTCYKESMDELNQTTSQHTRIFVKREAYIAAYYARPDLSIIEYREEFISARQGDLLLINTRTNEDESVIKDAPILSSIGREGAIFCVVKQVP